MQLFTFKDNENETEIERCQPIKFLYNSMNVQLEEQNTHKQIYMQTMVGQYMLLSIYAFI